MCLSVEFVGCGDVLEVLVLALIRSHRHRQKRRELDSFALFRLKHEKYLKRELKSVSAFLPST